MQKAILYVRVSSKEQEREGYSLDAQEKLGKKYAKENDLKIVRIWKVSESAWKLERKAFNQLIEYSIRHQEVKHIIFDITDRMTRNDFDKLKIYSLIKEHDKHIHFSRTKKIISRESGSDDEFMFDIEVAVAKKMSNDISRKAKMGMLEKAEQGKFPGGNIPLGYLLDKNTGEIYPDPIRSHLIVEMFNLYAGQKKSLSGLSAWAKSNSLTMPRSGRSPSKCQVERILRNPFYYGEFRWAGKIFKGSHQPIISKKLFLDVQFAFDSHNKPHLNRKSFAFRNLMECATCGCNITAQTKKNKYTYYHCTGMRGGNHMIFVREEDIADQLRSHLEPLSLDDYQINQILENLEDGYRRQENLRKGDIRRYRARIGQLESWSEKAYVDRLEGRLTEDQWLKFSNNWNDERIQIKKLLEASSVENEEVLYTAKNILELLQLLPTFWDKRNNFQRRKMVELLYSNCLLEGRSLSVTYRKPFDDIAKGARTKKWRG